MHADNPLAFRTPPSFFLTSDKVPHTDVGDSAQIVNHAHAVLLAVTTVHVKNPFAWVSVALETKAELPTDKFLTIPDFACQAII